MNPNDWLDFFLKWPRYKVAGTAVLVAFLIPILAGVVIAADAVRPSKPRDDTTATPRLRAVHEYAASPVATVEPNEPVATRSAASEEGDGNCTAVSPVSGSNVGGNFLIAGRCKALAGATIYVLVRDLYPNLTDSNGLQNHWIQCGPTIKDTGDFICGAFLCVNDAAYEILIVWPHTREALDEYAEWLKNSSNRGKLELPALGDISLIGSNHVVTANHELDSTPAACTALEAENESSGR